MTFLPAASEIDCASLHQCKVSENISDYTKIGFAKWTILFSCI